MTWLHLFAIVLGGLAVLPVLYAFRAFTGRPSPPRLDAAHSYPDLAGFDLSAAVDDRVASLRPEVRRSGSRSIFGAGERAGERPADARAHGVRPGVTFEYTILPHQGSMRQNAPDLGGFTKVPLLLYDRLGNCVMVHRRLSLN